MGLVEPLCRTVATNSSYWPSPDSCQRPRRSYLQPRCVRGTSAERAKIYSRGLESGMRDCHWRARCHMAWDTPHKHKSARRLRHWCAALLRAQTSQLVWPALARPRSIGDTFDRLRGCGARDAWGAREQRGSGEWRDLVWCGVVVVAAAAGLGFNAQTQSRLPAARARRNRAAFASGPPCAHSREIPSARGPHASSAHEND